MLQFLTFCSLHGIAISGVFSFPNFLEQETKFSFIDEKKEKDKGTNYNSTMCVPNFSFASMQTTTFSFVILGVNLQESVTEHLPMPALFQFLTLLAFKIFIDEEVNDFSFS